MEAEQNARFPFYESPIYTSAFDSHVNCYLHVVISRYQLSTAGGACSTTFYASAHSLASPSTATASTTRV